MTRWLNGSLTRCNPCRRPSGMSCAIAGNQKMGRSSKPLPTCETQRRTTSLLRSRCCWDRRFRWPCKQGRRCWAACGCGSAVKFGTLRWPARSNKLASGFRRRQLMLDGTFQVGRELRDHLGSIRWRVQRHEVGWVVRAGDGVAYVRGVPSVRYAELLARADGFTALAFALQPREVGVIFLDPAEHASAGDELRATGRVASVPVGEELLGRVVDALGRPLDEGPPIRAGTYWPVEREAPGVIERQPVVEPLHTGIKVIDALFPLGRGQRELILGDRATGKTALALDAILAQKDTGVVCIYA